MLPLTALSSLWPEPSPWIDPAREMNKFGSLRIPMGLMETTTESAVKVTEITPQEARICELLRVRVVAQAGDDVLAYLDERLEQLYPEEYKEYRRRWLALDDEERPGRMYDFVDWRVLVIQLAERTRLAALLGEPLDGYGRRMRRLLLLDRE